MPDKDTASGAAAADATTQATEPEKKPRKLVSDDDAAAAETKETPADDEQQAAETVAADAGADDTVEGAAGDEKPKPGTPDKALQKVQQDVASLTRFMQEIADSGEQPDADQVARIKQRRDKAVQSLRDAGMDEAADELAEMQGAIGKLDAVLADNETLREQVVETQASLAWMKQEAKYPNTDVHKVWDKAVEDAEQRVQKKLGSVWEEMTPRAQHQALQSEANELFDDRCKAVEAKFANRPAAPVKGKEQEQRPAATTKVTTTAVGAGAEGKPDPQAAALQRARRLVAQDE